MLTGTVLTIGWRLGGGSANAAKSTLLSSANNKQAVKQVAKKAKVCYKFALFQSDRNEHLNDCIMHNHIPRRNIIILIKFHFCDPHLPQKEN